MAKSIVAGVATEKASPRVVRHCAKCGEQELFCWCDVERQREQEQKKESLTNKKALFGGAA